MLTQKQEIFALALFEGLSQRQAYYRAYPASKKWKDNSVDQSASLLASSPKIIQRLAELREKAEKKSILKLETVIQELQKIALMDDEELEQYYKAPDKLKALDMLMKHLGGYEKDNSTKITAQIVTMLPEKDPNN